MNDQKKEIPVVEAWRLFSAKVEKRLRKKEREGFAGWDEDMPIRGLKLQMTGNALDIERSPDKCTPSRVCIDIAARAMMIERRRYMF